MKFPIDMIRTSTLILLFFLTLSHTFAQGSPSPGEVALDTLEASATTVSAQLAAAPDEVFRKNIIKMNLSSLALDAYNFSYERSLSRKTTVVAGYSFVPRTDVASIYLVEKAIDKFVHEEDNVIEELKATTIAQQAYTGAVRFYTGRKSRPGARGFYLSLYGRYMDLEAAYTHDYETDSRTYTLPFNGSLKGFGGGMMVGAQWLIAKRLTFDWYILGGHYGKLDVNMPAKADLSTMSESEKRGLKEDIESINSELNGRADVKTTVTDQGVSVTGKAPYAGIRGLGFSLGIAF